MFTLNPITIKILKNSIKAVQFIDLFQNYSIKIKQKSQDIIRMSQFSRYTTARGQQLLKGHKLSQSICGSYTSNYQQANYYQKQSLQPYNKIPLSQQYSPVGNISYPKPTYQPLQPPINQQISDKKQKQLEKIQQSASSIAQQEQTSCCTYNWLCCCLTFCGLLLMLIIFAAIATGILYYFGYLKFNINLSPQKSGQQRFDIAFKLPDSTSSQNSVSNATSNKDQIQGNTKQSSQGEAKSNIKPSTTFMVNPNQDDQQQTQAKTLFMYPTETSQYAKATTYMLPPQHLHRLHSN